MRCSPRGRTDAWPCSYPHPPRMPALACHSSPPHRGLYKRPVGLHLNPHSSGPQNRTRMPQHSISPRALQAVSQLGINPQSNAPTQRAGKDAMQRKTLAAGSGALHRHAHHDEEAKRLELQPPHVWLRSIGGVARFRYIRATNRASHGGHAPHTHSYVSPRGEACSGLLTLCSAGSCCAHTVLYIRVLNIWTVLHTIHTQWALAPGPPRAMLGVWPRPRPRSR